MWNGIQIAGYGDNILVAGCKGGNMIENGTSFASPMVAAGASLILQKYFDEFAKVTDVNLRNIKMINYLIKELNYPVPVRNRDRT
jgi:hypothetical protein